MSSTMITHYYGLKSIFHYKVFVSSLDISLVNPNLEAVVRLPIDNPRLIHSLKACELCDISILNEEKVKLVLYLTNCIEIHYMKIPEKSSVHRYATNYSQDVESIPNNP